MKPQLPYAALILILGSLTALSPFSIDMYLSAFPLMATFFGTDVSEISLTLSGYFIGLAGGQLIYGPLMDRFGRKKPLIVGLVIYVLASLGCAYSQTLNILIFFRVVQAVGGCAASVGAFAMVRDLFQPKESAKVFSLLILILGVSPLLAPTIGGYLSIYLGWSSLFVVLAGMGAALLAVVMKLLPESRGADTSHVLRPGAIARNYISILKEPQFYTYAVSGALAFSGLFVYLAASPTIFMNIFGVSEQVYGWIFAFIAMGMVGMSQLNVVLLKHFSNEQVQRGAIICLFLLSCIFFMCSYFGWYNIYSVVGTMFFFLSFIGLSNPNSAALAMAPFGSKAGSAASSIGFLQMSIGALASVCVGLLKAQALLPVAGIFVVSTLAALAVLFFGSRQITEKALASDDEMVIGH